MTGPQATMTIGSTPTETEVERLRARCIQALKDEQIINVQVKALQKKTKALRRRGRELQNNAAVNQADIEVALLEYAKATCGELCGQVYKTFPREIRDIIYSYVADCAKIRVEQQPSEHTEEICYIDMPSNTPLLHPRLNLDFVGPDIVREIGESVYRTAHFDFRDNFYLVPKFRVTDQWRLGLLPVSFVSNVEIFISCDDYQLGPSYGGMKDLNHYNRNPESVPWGHEIPQKIPSDILVGLESLFGFKPGTSITISLELDHSGKCQSIEREEWICENIVPLIIPTVQRLNTAGYRVRFVLIGDRLAYSPSPFKSDWNPMSAKDVTDSFWKYVEVQNKALQQELDDAEADESFSHFSTTLRRLEIPIWVQSSQANHGGDAWDAPPDL